MEKQSPVHVSIDGLMAYLSSSKSELTSDVISEALSFSRSNGGNWKFYRCSHCNQIFLDPQLHFEHLKSTHMEIEDIVVHDPSLFPVKVSSEWESMILSGTWKPIDTSAFLAMFQEQLELRRCDSAPKDVWWLVEKLKEFKIVMEASEYFSTKSLPLSYDLERESLLIIIRNLLLVLLFNGTLAEAHVTKLIRYCMKELEHSFPRLQTCLSGSNQMHMCICFLEASQLEKVVSFLQEISDFPPSPISDEINKHSTLTACTIGFPSKENIVLRGNLLCIDSDDELCGIDSSSHSVVHDDDCQDRRSVGEALLRWSSARHTNGEHVDLWSRLGEQRNNYGKYLLHVLEETFETLHKLLIIKRDRLRYNEELRLIFLEYIEELSSRIAKPGQVSKSFKTLLQNIENKTSGPYFWDFHRLRAASNVLEEARARTRETTLIGTATDFFDLESYFEMYSAAETAADSCIHEAFNRETENNDLELIKNDARIMRALEETQRLELMINSSALADYRVVLSPLLKSYSQAKIAQP